MNIKTAVGAALLGDFHERWDFYLEQIGAEFIVLYREMRRHMDFSTPPDHRAHAPEARPGVTDHGDRYVLLFVLSCVIVAFTMFLRDFAN